MFDLQMQEEASSMSFIGSKTTSVTTRDLSKNPSKVLRDALEHPVKISKYGQPIACLVSIDSWNQMMDQLRLRELEARARNIEG